MLTLHQHLHRQIPFTTSVRNHVIFSLLCGVKSPRFPWRHHVRVDQAARGLEVGGDDALLPVGPVRPVEVIGGQGVRIEAAEVIRDARGQDFLPTCNEGNIESETITIFPKLKSCPHKS